jgi:curved DNA-binding protein CbpA
MPELPDLYKVLQVDPEAEDEVIQAAYRRLAQKYHPDVAPDEAAAARMTAINAAWAVLRDVTTRAAYDAERAAAALRASSGPSRRTQDASRRTSSRPPRYAAAYQPPPRRRRRRRARLDGRPLLLRRRLRAELDADARRRRAAGRRPGDRRGPSSPSVAMPAGRWARSPVTTSSTSSGWTGCPSADPTAWRSTRSCERRVADALPAATRSSGGSSAAADPRSRSR